MHNGFAWNGWYSDDGMRVSRVCRWAAGMVGVGLCLEEHAEDFEEYAAAEDEGEDGCWVGVSGVS